MLIIHNQYLYLKSLYRWKQPIRYDDVKKHGDQIEYNNI